MSEPVTNVDIEDVLSSIRRLVSNSNDGQGDHASSDESTSDKLVLTPSLRIDDSASEATDAGAAAEEIAPAADAGLQASAVADDPEPHASDDTPTGDGSAVEETGAQAPVTPACSNSRITRATRRAMTRRRHSAHRRRSSRLPLPVVTINGSRTACLRMTMLVAR